ncbi:MAG: acyl carrier protein [Chloroflexi bacterium]|nr:acyl carrier protein [Chloroflexota bacterium]
MDKLLDILQDLRPEVDFESEQALIDDGLLDSFDIVTLVSDIRETFGVEVGIDDLVPANFNSVAAMQALIERLERA